MQKENLERFGLGTSRSYKSAQQKNVTAKCFHAREQQSLEAQKRQLEGQLDREERDLRVQLHRLKTEQKILSDSEYVDDDTYFTTEEASSYEEDIDKLASSPPEGAVNPYPVTFASTRHTSLPIKLNQDGKRFHRQRHPSIEFEDVDFRGSTSNLLPPLRRRQGSTTNIKTSKKLQRSHSLHVSSTSAASSLSAAKLQRSDSVQSFGGMSPEKDTWLGDPNAIASVRRPRRSLAQQRLSLAIARTNNDNSVHPSLAASMESLQLAAKSPEPAILKARPRLVRRFSFSPPREIKRCSPNSSNSNIHDISEDAAVSNTTQLRQDLGEEFHMGRKRSLRRASSLKKMRPSITDPGLPFNLREPPLPPIGASPVLQGPEFSPLSPRKRLPTSPLVKDLTERAST